MNVVDEYQALKSEQIDRIKQRDTFLNLNIVAIFAATAIAIPGGVKYSAWLLLPWTTSILGWTYLSNDDKVSALAHELRRMGGTGKALAWEKGNKGILPRSLRRAGDFVTFTIAFELPSVVALWAYISQRSNSNNPWTVWAIALCILEALLSIGLWLAYTLSAIGRARR